MPVPSRVECSAGDSVLVDMRDTLASDPVLVPAIVVGPYEDIAHEPMILVSINASEDHPWAQHNGGYFVASASPVYLRKL